MQLNKALLLGSACLHYLRPASNRHSCQGGFVQLNKALLQSNRIAPPGNRTRPRQPRAGRGQKSNSPNVGYALFSAVFVLRQTCATAPDTAPGSKYDYTARRDLARTGWMRVAQRYRHVAVKFIVGNYSDPRRQASVQEEQKLHGDFMTLPEVPHRTVPCHAHHDTSRMAPGDARCTVRHRTQDRARRFSDPVLPKRHSSSLS